MSLVPVAYAPAVSSFSASWGYPITSVYRLDSARTIATVSGAFGALYPSFTPPTVVSTMPWGTALTVHTVTGMAPSDTVDMAKPSYFPTQAPSYFPTQAPSYFPTQAPSYFPAPTHPYYQVYAGTPLSHVPWVYGDRTTPVCQGDSIQYTHPIMGIPELKNHPSLGLRFNEGERRIETVHPHSLAAKIGITPHTDLSANRLVRFDGDTKSSSITVEELITHYKKGSDAITEINPYGLNDSNSSSRSTVVHSPTPRLPSPLPKPSDLPSTSLSDGLRSELGSLNEYIQHEASPSEVRLNDGILAGLHVSSGAHDPSALHTSHVGDGEVSKTNWFRDSSLRMGPKIAYV